MKLFVIYSGVICLFRAVVEGLWLRFRGEQVEVCVRREQRRRVLQTLVWCIVTLILALFIPDIGRVISLIGGLAACFIFVFPGDTVIVFSCFWIFVQSECKCHTVMPLCDVSNRFVFDASQTIRDRQPICKVRCCLFCDILDMDV